MDLKELFKRLKGILLFGAAYLTAFFLMEARDVPIHIIHTSLDDRIPFCEYFIIPYVLWFVYVCGTVLYLGLSKSKATEYNRFILTMELGMIVFVITSLIYPNGQNLRPRIESDNIFTWAVNLLYKTDTCTNILPSLHVFASVACDIALCRDRWFKKHPAAAWGSHILAVLICLSTMFLKQHSVVDVICALICNLLFYPLVYCWEEIRIRSKIKKAQKTSKVSSVK